MISRWLLPLALVLTSLGGFAAGRHVTQLSCAAAQAAALADAQARRQDAQLQADAIAAEAENHQQKVRQHTRIIQQEVIRYVQNHPTVSCGLDADGLRLWNRANADAPDAATQPDQPLP